MLGGVAVSLAVLPYCLWFSFSLLSEVSPFGGGPLVAWRACQDGRGLQFAGRSGTGVAGCNSWSTSWHTYFSIDAS